MQTLERGRIDAIVRELEDGAYRLALELGLDQASAERAVLDSFVSLAPLVPRTAGIVELREKLNARIRQRAPRQEWVGASSEHHPVAAAAVSESLHIRAVDLLEEHQADEPIGRRRAVLAGAIGVALVVGVIAFLRVHADALAAALPTINEVSPAAAAAEVPLSGDVRVKFDRRPEGTPTIRLEPAHALLESAHWDGNTLVAVYSGLHLRTRYQIVLTADFRSRFNDVGHFEKRWLVTTRGYPVLGALRPAEGDTLAPRVGRISVDFSYTPPATPRVTIDPADATVTLGHWNGTTWTAGYTGLKPLTRYEATLTLDFGAAGASTQRRWSFSTEPGWPSTGAPVIWYGTSNLYTLPSDQRLVAIDWQGKLAGTSYPTTNIRQQAPDGSILLTQEGGYLDANGVTPGLSYAYPSTVRTADDSKSLCALDWLSTNQLWLETGPLRGPLRRVAPVGSPAPRSGFDIIACSVAGDRAVIAENGMFGTTAVRLIALSSGRVIAQRSYVPGGVSVISSHDGRLLAELSTSYDAQHDKASGQTVIRRAADGRVVAQLDNQRVLQFSWDGSRVVTVPFFGGPDVTLLDWQTRKPLWHLSRDPATDGQPVYAMAQPNGPAMAVALSDQSRTGDVDQLWIVAADGQATRVVSMVFYPAFGTGF